MLFVLASLSGCGSTDDEAPSAHGIYVVPASLDALSEETFFDHPWPSDFRHEADGSVRFIGFPNPREKPILAEYVDSMAGVLTAFSPAAAGYLRFTEALDPDSLPATPLDALEADSSVQLIDVTPGAPEAGERQRIALKFVPGPAVYYPPNTLAFMPAFGYPLAPSHRFTLVVTKRARTLSGKPLAPSSDLAQVLGLTSASGPRATLKSELADAVSTIVAAGVAKKSIVNMTVFTTDDPVADTETIRDWMLDNFPAPTVDASTWKALDADRKAGLMDVYEGVYGPSPDFQEGNIPFVNYGDGGALAFDASGTPVVQRQFDLRFTLAVPDAAKCPMPAAGYPIVLYAHGTGGNYRSLLGAGDEAESLAKRCIATMGIDQIFHGNRPGSGQGNVELLFFNVQNPVAARANGPESAIDVVQQARLFTESKAIVPASVSYTGADIEFDGSRVGFFGHSQGGLNGPMYMAVDDSARGGVLSGSGSMITIALLEKTEPVNVAGLVKNVFLGLGTTEEAELDEFHPAMSLAQTIVDPTDPIHYVGKIAQHPRPGFSPKSVLMTEGINADGTGDSYAPPHGIEVQAVALGLPLQNPVIHPIVEAAWSDLAPVTIPSEGLSGNLAGGKASGVLAQWEAAKASDGHFVIYYIPQAMSQCTGFVRNFMDDPVGRVPAP